MPKRLGTLLVATDRKKLEDLCDEKYLNDYEKEIIIRIYWKKQSLNYIADTMDFTKHGKEQKFYCVRSINTFHKLAFNKLMK